MSYASKELVERAVAYLNLPEGVPLVESIFAIVSDLGEATPLPDNWCAPVGDAVYGEYRPDAEHEAAVENRREEAMRVTPTPCHVDHPDMRVLHVSEIDDICDLARRAPRPEPTPEPRASSALLEASEKVVDDLGPPTYLRCGEWLTTTLGKLYRAIKDEEARGPSEPAIKAGDYVIASKYQDGDPCDGFAVGFVERITDAGRVIVVNDRGEPFRAGGYRRAKCITRDEGRALVELSDVISDKPGESVWWHLARIREARGPSEVYPRFCDSCSDSIYDDEGELIRNPRIEQLRKERDEARAAGDAKLLELRAWAEDDWNLHARKDLKNNSEQVRSAIDGRMGAMRGTVKQIDRLLSNPPDNPQVLSENDEIERLREERDEALARAEEARGTGEMDRLRRAREHYKGECEQLRKENADLTGRLELALLDIVNESEEAELIKQLRADLAATRDELGGVKAQLSAALEAVDNAWRGRTALEAAIARRRW